MTITSALALALSLFSAAAAAQHAPHEHGVATLQVALDGSRLHVELDSPLDNLVGFEHAPRTAREREALDAMARRLRDPGALFELPAAAACVAAEPELALPHGPDAGKAAGAHSDVRASYAFECAAPAQLTKLRIGLFEAFPRLKRLRVDAVGAAGQKRLVLDKSRRDLPL